MHKWLKLIRLKMTILLLTCLLAACSTPYKEQFDRSESNLGQRDQTDVRTENERRAYGYTQQSQQQHHNNKKMHLSLNTGTKLSSMPGVHVAHVIVTDLNAYVAIVLDNSATGTLESGTPHSSTPPAGSRDGRAFHEDGELKTDLDPPFTTPDEANISSKLKQKIALKVRDLNPHVIEVFISANENFNTWLGRYHRLQWTGESLDSYVSEFNESIEQFFPPPNSDL